MKEESIYCFCGKSKQILKSIEKHCSNKWKKLVVDQDIISNYNLRAICYKDRFLVFGGYFRQDNSKSKSKPTFSMQLINEEGKVVYTYKGVGMIPLLQGENPCLQTEAGEVLACIMYRGKERLRRFNGKSWGILETEH